MRVTSIVPFCCCCLPLASIIGRLAILLIFTRESKLYSIDGLFSNEIIASLHTLARVPIVCRSPPASSEHIRLTQGSISRFEGLIDTSICWKYTLLIDQTEREKHVAFISGSYLWESTGRNAGPELFELLGSIITAAVVWEVLDKIGTI